jgi:hypothetical protein
VQENDREIEKDIGKLLKKHNMQEKYVGDIGDFGKFYLLKNLIPDGFNLEINWYEFPDNGRGGGCKLWYDEQPCFSSMKKAKKADPELYEKIRNLETNCNLGGLEGIARQYFPKINSHKVVQFCDPNNGFLPSENSTPKGKYIPFADIEKYFNEGKSIVVYQHISYDKNQIQNIFKKLTNILNGRNAEIYFFHIEKGNGFGRVRRYYCLIIHPDHKKEFAEKIENLPEIIEEIIK